MVAQTTTTEPAQSLLIFSVDRSFFIRVHALRKALFFVYCGYLQSEYAGDFLPKILGETLEAILSMFGDRIGKLLLKQAVEQNVCNHILASDTDIDAATYQKMRGMSYQEVLRTNGQISFPEVLRQQKRL